MAIQTVMSTTLVSLTKSKPIKRVIEAMITALGPIADPAEHQRAERRTAKLAANATNAYTSWLASLRPEKSCLPMITAGEPYR